MFPGEENAPTLCSRHFTPVILITSLYASRHQPHVIYVRKLSLGKPAHSVTCLSQDPSQACQTPSSTPSSTPYKPERPLPFLAGFGLARKIFSPTWLKREIPKGKALVSLALRVQCKERVLRSEEVRRLSASSISYFTSSLALRSTARGVQSRRSRHQSRTLPRPY